MTTFVLIHGAGDSGWYWHLVAEELRVLGHDTVAPDLPVERSPTLVDCVNAVVLAVGNPSASVAIVAQSFGSFIGPLAAQRLPTHVLVLVAGMVPAPGRALPRPARLHTSGVQGGTPPPRPDVVVRQAPWSVA